MSPTTPDQRSARPSVVLIDNYDSFTFNIVQYLRELGADVLVVENDRIAPDDLVLSECDGIVLSPGPGTPQEAGVSFGVLRAWAATKPVLGICLGHQVIAEYFGGRVLNANRIMHGKVSVISNDGMGVFKGLPSEFCVARYHSLLVDAPSLPDTIEVTCTAHDPTGVPEIMGIRHRSLRVEGIQFHPEAIQSEHGHAMLANWLKSCQVETG